MASAWYTFVHDNASLFGGAVGASLTFIFLGLKQSFGRPRLSLQFNPGDDAYLSESTHAEGDITNVTRKYLRVSLTATGLFGTGFGGLSGAKSCRIYITSIQPIANGRAHPDQLYDARQLSWPPNKMFEARDIPRGVTMFANVVTMKKGGLHWHFQIPDSYGLSQELLTHPGRLRIAVTATADNAKPVTRHIKASVKADRSGFDAEMGR